jgi:predicted nucleotidyltransferase
VFVYGSVAKGKETASSDIDLMVIEVHKSSKEEIANLLGIVDRDLKDTNAKDVSNDWRFAIAYNASRSRSLSAKIPRLSEILMRFEKSAT